MFGPVGIARIATQHWTTKVEKILGSYRRMMG